MQLDKLKFTSNMDVKGEIMFNIQRTLFDYNNKRLKDSGMRDRPDRKEFYRIMVRSTAKIASPQEFVTALCHFQTEDIWGDLNRPYYNVHPAMTATFCRNRLDFPIRYVVPPYPVMAVCFDDHDPIVEIDGVRLRSCLVNKSDKIINVKTMEETDDKRIQIWMDFGETSPSGEPIYNYKNLMWKDDQVSVEQTMTLPDDPSAAKGLQIPKELVLRCVKLVVSICFMTRDKESPLVLPHVLNKDVAEFPRANTETRKKMHDRAIASRESVGYLVGSPEMYDMGYLGSIVSTPKSDATGKHLDFAHIVSGHWKLVRYGANMSQGRVQWIMPYVKAKDKPFKPVS